MHPFTVRMRTNLSASPPDDAPTTTQGCLPDRIGRALQLLDDPTPSWDALEALLCTSPQLMAALLLVGLDALPEPSGHCPAASHDTLSVRLQHLLRALGPDLCRVWLMTEEPHIRRCSQDTEARVLRQGRCAYLLAQSQGYPAPDEALIGALLIGLQTASLGSITDTSGAALPAGASAALADALSLAWPLPAETLQTAHPLLRLIGCAQWLAQPGWQERSAQLTRLSGLPVTVLESILTSQPEGQTRTDHPVFTAAQPSSIRDLHALKQGNEATGLPSAPEWLRSTALRGSLRAAFDELDDEVFSRRQALARGLLGKLRANLLLCCDDHGVMLPPDGCEPASRHAFMQALRLSVDDPVSVVALTARSGRPAKWQIEHADRSRSLVDWQIARRLGTSCLTVHPLGLILNAEKPAVLVTACTPDQLGNPHLQALLALASALVNASRIRMQRARVTASLEADIKQHYREYTSRVAHEARNPLTVMRNYLETLGQRYPGAHGLSQDLALVNTEIERLTQLMGQLAAGPHTTAHEAAHCDVASVLREMRQLYGVALFERHDILFDLRLATELPLAAMPASALKQILLNLLRNASEALQAGGRCSVVVPAQLLLANGKRCIEIRVIDNGPGLPAARMDALNTPGQSSKQGEHQGLGLSVVDTLLREWHGSMLCRSQAGTGTSFQLLVPVVDSR